MLENRHEEILELMWTIEEEDGTLEKDQLIKMAGFTELNDVFKPLVQNEYIKIHDSRVEFTRKGREGARLIIRRHRLAERLLHDVLELKEDAMDSNACKFEHFLDEEVTTSICTLLGHPMSCPHGKTIPPGECCKKANKEIQPVVLPLTELKSGDRAKVTYIVTKFHGRLDRLSSLGLLPGVKIHLHQRRPSFVIQLGETQIAIDDDVARDIYVRYV